jgi:hypothetical protein
MLDTRFNDLLAQIDALFPKVSAEQQLAWLQRLSEMTNRQTENANSYLESCRIRAES